MLRLPSDGRAGDQAAGRPVTSKSNPVADVAGDQIAQEPADVPPIGHIQPSSTTEIPTPPLPWPALVVPPMVEDVTSVPGASVIRSPACPGWIGSESLVITSSESGVPGVPMNVDPRSPRCPRSSSPAPFPPVEVGVEVDAVALVMFPQSDRQIPAVNPPMVTPC